MEARTDDAFLSSRCYGSRPQGGRKCTDRGAALRRFRRLVREEGNHWVAKLDVKKFFDRLPHARVLDALAEAVPDNRCRHELEGYMAWYWRESWPGHTKLPPEPRGLPQGSPVSGVLANIFMTSFDKSLTAAGAEHIRYIDDITLVAKSPEQLVKHLALAMQLILDPGLELNASKTRVAYLGPGMPSHAMVKVSGCAGALTVRREFDLLGVHFYGDGRWRARHRTVNRLLSKVRRIIDGKGKSRSPVVRYMIATAMINRMLGYHVGVRRPGARPKPKAAPTPGPTTRSSHAHTPSSTGSVHVAKIRRRIYVMSRVWISGLRFVQPRQHALLGHSPLVAAQMHRVDALIHRWMRRAFKGTITAAKLSPEMLASLRGRRVRSAKKMYEMAADESPPQCPGADA